MTISEKPGRLVAASLALALSAGCATTANSAVDVAMPADMEIKPVERTTNANPQRTYEVLMGRGDFAGAAEHQRRLVEADPENEAARMALAEALRMAGQTAEANSTFASLTDSEGWRAEALMGLARIALASGEYGVAARTFASAAETDPGMWRAWLGLGQARDRMGNWQGADEAYDKALIVTSAPAIVHNNHGVSYLARGDSFSAADAFREALRIDAGFDVAATNLDLAMAAAGGEPDQGGGDAVSTARRLNNFGYVAMVNGREEDAVAYFDAAISAHPSFYARAYENRESIANTRRD